MISPHPDTAFRVAEAARHERLARLSEAHRYPAPIFAIWARFRSGPVIRWFEPRAPRTAQRDAGNAAPRRVSITPASTAIED